MARRGNSSGFVDTLTRPYGRGANDPVRLVGHVAGVLSIGAGVIHVSAAGDHTNLPVMFAGFLAVAALQMALGALLMWRRPSRLVLAAAVALMLGAVGTWVLSRTAGLPFLEDGHAEPIGLKDAVTVLFEIASIPPLLLLFSRELERVTLPSPRLASQTMMAVGAATFALLTPAMLLEGGGHHSHEQAVELGIHDEHDEAAADESADAHEHEIASADAADRHGHDERGADRERHPHSEATDGGGHEGGTHLATAPGEPVDVHHTRTAPHTGTPPHTAPPPDAPSDGHGRHRGGHGDRRDRPHERGGRHRDHEDGHGDQGDDPPAEDEEEPLLANLACTVERLLP